MKQIMNYSIELLILSKKAVTKKENKKKIE